MARYNRPPVPARVVGVVEQVDKGKPGEEGMAHNKGHKDQLCAVQYHLWMKAGVYVSERPLTQQCLPPQYHGQRGLLLI